jgi:phosphoribosylamine--glycine ligase
LHILILGSGGREHSIAWAVKQNPKCTKLTCAPGNAGMQQIGSCINLDINDGNKIKTWAKKNNVDLVIIGPEEPLSHGVSDILNLAGILTFAPSMEASKLESSKHFTKQICNISGAPTAKFKHFKDQKTALKFLNDSEFPLVIKADGLAAGKGVIIASTHAEAVTAINDMFGGQYGDAGAEVIIEEFMVGEEVSLFVLCDDTDILSIGSAQDHKRAYDNDAGPNTGGMGAYSPAPILTAEIEKKAISKIIEPCLKQMKKLGTPYKGVLYAGLMIKDEEPKLVEFNARLGDPECQVLMMRLGAQILDLILATCENRLVEARAAWADDHAITIVIAAKGYPNAYDKGFVISETNNIVQDSNNMLFHAGTKLENEKVISTGGRVLNATTRGSNLKEAKMRAYEMVKNVNWKDGFYRSDIGWRAL